MTRWQVNIQNMLAREHVNTQGTLAREHVSMQDTLELERVGTLARGHVSTQGTLTREHIFNTHGMQFRRLLKFILKFNWRKFNISYISLLFRNYGIIIEDYIDATSNFLRL